MSDTQSFAEFVEAHQFGAETLYQATRSFLAERLDYPDPGDLMVELAGEINDVYELGARLEKDGLLLEDAALCVLDAVWRDPGERSRLQRAVANATAKLPVVDPAEIVPFVLYGLHVLLRNSSRSERTVVRGRDGKTKTTTIEETGALAVLLGAIRRGRKGPGK